MVYVDADGAIVHYNLESSFVSDVKVKKGLDPIFVELNDVVLKKFVQTFCQEGDGAIRYQVVFPMLMTWGITFIRIT